MDLNLSLGLHRSRRRHSGHYLGSALSLVSPAAPPTISPLASPSSSTENCPAAAADDNDDLSETPGGLHSPFSPSRSLFADAPDHLLPTTGGADDAPVSEYTPLSPSYQSDVPYDPLYPTGPPEEALVGAGSTDDGDSPHVPYSPPYLPSSAIPSDHEDDEFTPYQSVVVPLVSNLGEEDRVTPLTDLSESEFRIRMLIDLRRRLRSIRQFQSAVSPIHTTEQLDHNMPRSEEAIEDPEKNGARVAGVSSEVLEQEKQDRGSAAVGFDCNICLEVAKEPVVTSCGHLFCWPCLYQWLHLYCSHRECPVCKGEVGESSITPIYGRGRSETVSEEREGDVGGSGLTIPPRPRGRRAESWRQGIPRPVSRRFRGGIVGSWRYLFGEQLWHRSRGVADWVPNLQETVDGAYHRLRSRRATRVGENPESEYSSIGHAETASNATDNTQNGVNTSSVNQDGVNRDWFYVNSSDRSRRLAAFTARLSRIFSRPASSSNESGASASSANSQNPDDPVAWPPNGSSQGVDQFPTSSTIAVIQEDADVATGPNSAGSSSSLGRRGGSSFSGSLDVDGCLLHACKRRRLN